MCRYRNIPIEVYGSSAALGRAIGRETRVVLAITDEGLAEAYKKARGKANG